MLLKVFGNPLYHFLLVFCSNKSFFLSYRFQYIIIYLPKCRGCLTLNTPYWITWHLCRWWCWLSTVNSLRFITQMMQLTVSSTYSKFMRKVGLVIDWDLQRVMRMTWC